MWQLFLEREAESGPVVTDQTFIAVAVIGLIAIVAMTVFSIIFWSARFQKEMHHLNLRIRQARSEHEREYYLQRRKRLYWSIIPFVRYSKNGRKHKHRHHHHHKKDE